MKKQVILGAILFLFLQTAMLSFSAGNFLQYWDNQLENPKLAFELAESLRESTNSWDKFDVIVKCTQESYPYSMFELSSEFGFKVTDYLTATPTFRASMDKSTILTLAAMPQVVWLDQNSRQTVACMSTARSYSNIDNLRNQHGSLDGNLDGNLNTYSTNDVVIALLDTGIDTGHLDLDEGKVVGWVDKVNGYGSPYDDNGHGTHCASIAAGDGDGNFNYRGVAPGAALVGVKMLDSAGSTDKITALQALNWVWSNVETYSIDVVSCSWGFIPDAGDYRVDFGVYEEVAQLVDSLIINKNVVVCIAAGNEGFPGTYDRIRTPGTAKYAITVGNAKDPGEGGWELYRSSGRGPCDDGRIKPDVLAPGFNIMAAKKGTTNEYKEMTGTSMATPFIAGVVSLFLDYDMNLKYHYSDYNPKVKHLLTASATDVYGDTTPGKDNDYGAGRIDGLDIWNFLTSDVSSAFSNAPTVIGYSDTSYSRNNEPLWRCDTADYYKLYVDNGERIWAAADADPDLQLFVTIYDKYYRSVASTGYSNYATILYTVTYTGIYYVRVGVQTPTGDWYDIDITVAGAPPGPPPPIF